MTEATSAGFPILSAGMSDTTSASSSSDSLEFISVSINPHATALTLIPLGASSLASAFVKASRPPFDAEYATSIDAPLSPQTEDTFIILPENSESICGIAALHI